MKQLFLLIVIAFLLVSLACNKKNDLPNEIKPLISDIKNDEILTREKVLELLDCSETWLSKMTNNGTILAIRIGNRVYYSKQGILNIGKEKGKRKKKAIL